MNPSLLVALGLLGFGAVAGVAYWVLAPGEEPKADLQPPKPEFEEAFVDDAPDDVPPVVRNSDDTPAGDIRLGPNFLLSEFTRSNRAEQLGIDNTPSAEEIERLRLLVRYVLQPLRSRLNVPLNITSGFRSEALNASLPGASPTSQHRLGLAADFKSNRLSSENIMRRLWNAVKGEGAIPVDQVILYHPSRGGHIHVSYRPEGGREQFLYAPAGGGYEAWTP